MMRQILGRYAWLPAFLACLALMGSAEAQRLPIPEVPGINC